MQRTSFREMNCSVAQCLEVVGEWWSMLIVRDLFLGVTRFDRFHERLGISRNILTDRLDNLVEHGVLERHPYQENPVRYDYTLTEKGQDLWLVLTAIYSGGLALTVSRGPWLQMGVIFVAGLWIALTGCRTEAGEGRSAGSAAATTPGDRSRIRACSSRVAAVSQPSRRSRYGAAARPAVTTRPLRSTPTRSRRGPTSPRSSATPSSYRSSGPRSTRSW